MTTNLFVNCRLWSVALFIGIMCGPTLAQDESEAWSKMRTASSDPVFQKVAIDFSNPQQVIHQASQAYASRYPNGIPLTSSGDVMVFMEEGPMKVIYRNQWVVRPEYQNYSQQTLEDLRRQILAGFRSKTCSDRIFRPLLQKGVTVEFKSVYAGKTLAAFIFSISDC
ncbi:MAG: hypothetical protein IPF38_01530 [Burkholderiales bacterium]|nr:hypothetical protein [Burkholderiales bacterium]